MRAVRRIRQLMPIVLAVALGAVSGGLSQVVRPTPPKRYGVTLRYLLDYRSNQRIEKFRQFVQELEQLGFRRTDEEPPREEAADREFTTMSGTIPAGKEMELLNLPAFRGAILYPEGKPVPANANQLVTIEYLVTPYQARDWRQRLERLTKQGFVEFLGYDNRGHARLVGSIAAGKVEGLLPPARYAELKNSPRGGLILYRPDPPDQPTKELPPPEPPFPPEQLHLLKVSPELRQKLDAKEADRRIRFEVLLHDPDMVRDPDYLRELGRVTQGGQIEYTLDSLVVLTAPRRMIERLARLEFVQSVRSPRPATSSVSRAPIADKEGPDLAGWAIERLHRVKGVGQGVQVVVISDDFRGWSNRVGNGLPQDTTLLDLTAETDRDLQPAPEKKGKANELGEGTAQALAVARLAPKCKLVLVRIGRAAPYQLLEVVRHLRHRPSRSPALLQRGQELVRDGLKLNEEREQLNRMRRAALEIAPDDPNPENQKSRQDYLKKQAAVEREEREYQERRNRYFSLVEGLLGLAKSRVVVSGLVWNDGYPVTGVGELSQEIAAIDPSKTIWLQAAGDTARQSWTGLLRDVDRNGFLELLPPGFQIPKGRWSRELNFLGWKPDDDEVTQNLPAGVTIRLSVQWREAIDPLLRSYRDPAFYTPSSTVGFVVLRQRDPTAKSLPTDTMELIDRSPSRAMRMPQRLYLGTNQAVYEHTIEFRTSVAGRYAVMLQGEQHHSLRPEGEETVPGQVRRWEMQPRVFVQLVDPEGKLAGRPIWLDDASAVGEMGTPADVQRVVVVGASDGKERRSYSPSGSPQGMALRRRPELLLPDTLPDGRTGTAISAGFAGGLAACAISAGIPPENLSRAWSGKEQTGWTIAPESPSR